MGLKTTKQQFRQKHFKTIHRIIVENFGVSIQNENAEISSFCFQEADFVMFDYYIKQVFNIELYSLPSTVVEDILDLVCQN